MHPAFRFPQNGVWGVIFDEIDPILMDFKGFQHIQHQGLAGGQVLMNVASIILDHYTVCNAGAYVFSAADDHQHLRRTDLADIYCKLLGLNGERKSRLFDKGFLDGKHIVMYQQEEEVMSSRLKVINYYSTSAERLSLEMGERLQKAAGKDLKNKLESGEIKLINGRYVGESLKVNRSSTLKARLRKAHIPAQ